MQRSVCVHRRHCPERAGGRKKGKTHEVAWHGPREHDNGLDTARLFRHVLEVDVHDADSRAQVVLDRLEHIDLRAEVARKQAEVPLRRRRGGRHERVDAQVDNHWALGCSSVVRSTGLNKAVPHHP